SGFEAADEDEPRGISGRRLLPRREMFGVDAIPDDVQATRNPRGPLDGTLPDVLADGHHGMSPRKRPPRKWPAARVVVDARGMLGPEDARADADRGTRPYDLRPERVKLRDRRANIAHVRGQPRDVARAHG